jgi:NADH-quinone oxidoreductase subunit C
MTQPIASLKKTLASITMTLGEKIITSVIAFNEITIEIAPKDYLSCALLLRDTAGCQFEQLIDLCGVDYQTYGEGAYDGPRYCVVLHLLSISLNQRVRVKIFCDNDALPSVDSLCTIWSSADWFEREAFDLFGIVFVGHEDLRRILTDYGFIGHPFRKDFPTEGNVEMRYDTERACVVYQPVTIESRDITPRIIRENGYGGGV